MIMPDPERVRELTAELRDDLAHMTDAPPYPTREELTTLLAAAEALEAA